MASSAHTTQLHEWLERMRKGDREAADQLLRAVSERLELLCNTMFRRSGRLRQLEDADDVLQNATIRLLRSLKRLEPHSMRDFFGLAATEIRRELIDLARHHLGRNAQRPQTQKGFAASEQVEPCAEDLDRWTGFHEAVEQLPVVEREVVSLAFYHGQSKADISDTLGVDPRTVRRWWNSACMHLRAKMSCPLPSADD